MAKQKMKSHRGACKRFKITGSGKVKRNKAYKSHILTKKSHKRKRGLRKATTLNKRRSEENVKVSIEQSKEGRIMARVKKGVNAHKRHKKVLKHGERLLRCQEQDIQRLRSRLR